MYTLIALITILVGVGSLFDQFLKEDKVAKVRTQIFHWWEQLRSIDNREVIKGSNAYFVDLFDQIYGRKHFSVKTIVRSCFFSITALVIAFIVCILLKSSILLQSMGEDTDEIVKGVVSNGFGYWFYLILFVGNLFADYFSLIETRFILRLSSRSSIIYFIPLIFADLLLSLLCYLFIGVGVDIAIIVFHGIIISGGISSHGFVFDFVQIIYTYFIGLSIGIAEALSSTYLIKLHSPLIYSTFFTSILFYLFFLFSLLIRLLFIVRIPMLPTLRWLGCVNNPIKALVGIPAAIIMIYEGVKRLMN